MPQTIQVRARNTVIYQGQTYAPGDLFRAAIPDALSLRHRRRVDFAPNARPQPVEPPSPSGAGNNAGAPRGEFVEAGETAAASTSPPNDDDDDAKPSRRRYRRRDLKAEP